MKTVQPIQEAIDETEQAIEDAALDGEYDLAEKLTARLKKLEEQKDVGEVYALNF